MNEAGGGGAKAKTYPKSKTTYTPKFNSATSPMLVNPNSKNLAAHTAQANTHNQVAQALNTGNSAGADAAKAAAYAQQAQEANMAAVARAVARAAAANAPVAAASNNPRANFGAGGGGPALGAAATPTPIAAPVPAPVEAPPAPPPPPVTIIGGEQNVPGESFTTTGGQGTYGNFLRERQARGPRSGTSITPEMLMRIARQRFSNQR